MWFCGVSEYVRLQQFFTIRNDRASFEICRKCAKLQVEMVNVLRVFAIFGDKAEIEAHMSRFMQELRDSNKADGQDRIYTHGEKELSNFENIKQTGLKASEKTYEELLLIAKEASLDSSLLQ